MRASLSQGQEARAVAAPYLTIVVNEEKAVEDSEGDGVDYEKVHRCNHFAVVLEKCLPLSDLFGAPRCPLDPTRNGALREIEAEHLQFPVNVRGSPGGVLGIEARKSRASASVPRPD